MEASRKYMMGTGLVLNDTSMGAVEGASEIVGIFIIRGKDYMPGETDTCQQTLLTSSASHPSCSRLGIIRIRAS